MSYGERVDRPYSIGALSRAVGVPTSTVRYYDRRGLLRPNGRTDGNYRVYDASALKRLHFIRAAQANGFSLDDIVVLLRFRDGATSSCNDVQVLINERLADLKRRLDQLQHVQAILRALLRRCRATPGADRCVVIEDLKKESSSSAARSDHHRGKQVQHTS